jgi:YHS domain-containing protein
MKVIDPVCGMRTNPERTVAQEDYGGVTFFFCSEECHRLFNASPERYIARVQQLRDTSAEESGEQGYE